MIQTRQAVTQQASRPAGRQASGPTTRLRITRILRSKAGRKPIRHHWELDVHQFAVDVAMQIFELSKKWPAEEKFSLTDQARRSSRSVTAQIAEAWRKRKYEAAFVSKLNDAEGEAAETQDWVMFAVKCGYIDRQIGIELHHKCDRILGKLTNMGNNPGPWILNRTSPKPPD